MVYRLTDAGCVVRLSDGVVFPPDPANSDCAAYLAWLDAGNTPEPYKPPAPAVPHEVTMRQARLALAGAGLLAQIDNALAALPEPQRTVARIEWEYSGTVQRDKPLVLALAPALGLTDAQLNALFTKAVTL